MYFQNEEYLLSLHIRFQNVFILLCVITSLCTIIFQVGHYRRGSNLLIRAKNKNTDNDCYLLIPPTTTPKIKISSHSHIVNFSLITIQYDNGAQENKNVFTRVLFFRYTYLRCKIVHNAYRIVLVF